MKNRTSGFKEAVKKLGREVDIKLTIGTTEVARNKINRVCYSYEGQILKSVMKKLELDLDKSISITDGDEVNLQIGIKVNGSYEYLDYGNFVYYSSEISEDKKSIHYELYDKMLYFMKDYTKTNFNFTFPMTVAEYITALCNEVGITPPSSYTGVPNYNKVISKDKYLDDNGNELGYIARDIMDQLAEVTASILYVDENDTLVIGGVNKTNDTINESYLDEDNVEFGDEYGPVTTLVLSRSAGADKISISIQPSVQAKERVLEISDNQIMNDNDRDTYMNDIISKLFDDFNIIYGLAPIRRGYYNYYDVKSKGVLYYDIFDSFKVQIGNKTYNCLMMSDEIIIEQGIEERFYAEEPKQDEQDFSKMTGTDRTINRTTLQVDKQKGQILGYVNEFSEYKKTNDDKVSRIDGTTKINESTLFELTKSGGRLETMEEQITDAGSKVVNSVVNININGINVSTNQSAISTLINNERFVVMNGSNPLAFFGYDSEDDTTKAYLEHLKVGTYFIAGYHRTEKMQINGEYRTGWFYVE